MLSVILIWFYVLSISFILGCFFQETLMKAGQTKEFCTTADSLFMAGVGVLIFYSQLFSIFYKVGLAANLILILTVLGLAVIIRKRLCFMFKQYVLSMGKYRLILWLFLFLLFAYGTSRGSYHYDTGLYHGQAIRWIEEYGVVKGLGNFYFRLAYNSASFCFSALFSMAFISGRSYHCMSGLMALMLVWTCAEGLFKSYGKHPRVSDFVRAGALYYTISIFHEMISPASDYFAMILVFYIIIKWLDLWERKEESWQPYGVLCLLVVTAIAVKLSTAMLLLLVLKPAIKMIREKAVRSIAIFIGLGIINLLPFLLRNMIISGWLIYPYSGIDLLNVDWKMSKEMVDHDYKEIQVWGRGYTDVAQYDVPFHKWVTDWFVQMNGLEKLLVILAVSAVLVLFVWAGYMGFKRKTDYADWLLAASAVAVSFLFWLTSAPLFRYGYAYIIILPLLVYGFPVIYLIREKKILRKLAAAGVSLAVLLRVGVLGADLVSRFEMNHFIIQKDYDLFGVIPSQIERFTIYNAVNIDQIGYHSFPSVPNNNQRVSLRGDSLADGFRFRE